MLDEDLRWLRATIELSRRCPPATTAYSVGAILVFGDTELASGYSRQNEPTEHAEEAALGLVAPDDPRLRMATLYCSLEPCSARRSRPGTCTDLIIDRGLQRVVFALREPLALAECHGAELLAAAGVDVVEVTELSDEVIAVNTAVLGGGRAVSQCRPGGATSPGRAA